MNEFNVILNNLSETKYNETLIVTFSLLKECSLV